MRKFFVQLFVGLALISQVNGAKAAPAKSNSAWPSINSATKPDQRGKIPSVMALQYLLRARKFYHGKIDGVYGKSTTSAVKAFQRSRQLKVDGIAGPQTLSALVIKVQLGSKGDAVRALQELLRDSYEHVEGDLRAPTLAVDGVFGQKTKETVLGAQQDFNLDQFQLKEDGIVGPHTWRLLFNDAVTS